MSLSKYNKTTKELEPIAGGFDVQGILDDIGDLTDLDTSTKTDLVSAVNEVKSDIPTKNSDLTNDSGFVGLGETATTAYAGNKGKANAEAIEAIISVNGSCNILPNNASGQTAHLSVDFTFNSDGSCLISGTPTGRLGYHEICHSYLLKKGTYKISSGLPSSSNIFLSIAKTSDGLEIVASTSSEDGIVEFTIADDTYINAAIGFSVPSDLPSVSGTIYPMLYDARLNPTGYVPYAMTNRELTERVNKSPDVIIADGAKTYKQLLCDLFVKATRDKIIKNLSTVRLDVEGWTMSLSARETLSTKLYFGCPYVGRSDWFLAGVIMDSNVNNCSLGYVSNGVFTDLSTEVPGANVQVTLYY